MEDRRIPMELLPLEAVTSMEGQPVTSSRIVAEAFGRRHDSVLRDIQTLLGDLHKIVEISPPEKAFADLNFVLSSYTDPMNRQQPEYLMTKDGFMLLVMGYTGAKAMALKVAYINAFNTMAGMLTAPALPAAASQRLIARGGAVEVDFFEGVRKGLLGEQWGLFPFNYKPPRFESYGKSVLGRYDGAFYYLDTFNAYGLYEKQAAAPVPMRVLYACLVHSGFMVPYEDPRHGDRLKMTKTVDMWTRKAAAIRIRRDIVDLPIIHQRRGAHV